MFEGTKTEVIFCRCHSPEHQIILNYWPDDKPNEKELYVSIHLNNYDNFLRRLWIGLKYAFGYRCKYGNWDEIIISPEVAKDLWTYLAGFIEDKNTNA